MVKSIHSSCLSPCWQPLVAMTICCFVQACSRKKSEEQTVRANSLSPGLFSLPEQENSPTSQAKVSWSTSLGAKEYEVTVAKDNACQDVLHRERIPGTSYESKALNEGMHFVCVVAIAGEERTKSDPPSRPLEVDLVTWDLRMNEGGPSGRYEPAAVLTDSGIFVWGGRQEQTTLADGAMFETASSTWRTVATVGSPEGRYGAVAIWTGKVVLVVGGSVNGRRAVGNGIYDPKTNLWSTMPPLPASDDLGPGLNGVWTGQEALFFGNGKGVAFNPDANTWRILATSGAPEDRGDHATVWTGSKMLVWGGSTQGEIVGKRKYLSDGGLYDPATDSWTAITNQEAPGPRVGASAVWTGESLIIYGGREASSDELGSNVFKTGAIYSPKTDQWLKLDSQVGPQVANHRAIWTGDKMILVGGNDSNSHDSMTRIYDLQKKRWWVILDKSINGPDKGYRDFPFAAWTGNSLILWGGWDSRKTESTFATGGIFKL